MALPTVEDIVFSNVIADRILMKQNFERLRDRPASKYFKNVKIKDVEWSKNFDLPSNFPPSFLKKYPYDFEISYDVLGCNMLKCYKHDYSKPCGETPFVINKRFFGCAEACYGVFEEFNRFLFEVFDLPDKTSSTTTRKTELPLETMSIVDNNNNCCYCGIQLVDLKKFALLPSARYENIDGIEGLEIEEYVEKYKDQPLKLSDMAGLVDAPPLGWAVDKQDVYFTSKYCGRFVKKYDYATDQCYDEPHRKILGYLFGENVVKLFPDVDHYFTGPLPLNYIVDAILKRGLNVNVGYSERNITQKVLELNQHHSFPDKRIGVGDRVTIMDQRKKSSSTSVTAPLVHAGEELNSILVDILKNVATDVGIEAAVTQSPLIISKLLKYYGPKVLNKVLYSAQSVFVPMTTRLSSLLIRSLISDLCIQLATRALAVASSVASAVFAVSIITMVPDFLISYYNICGFNNEITRSQVDERKRLLVDQMLRYLLDTHKGSLSYINIVNEDDDHYISPLITPEYIYSLCILNFINEFPEKKITVGFNGIDPVKQIDISTEYIIALTENSAGQRIDLLGNKNNASFTNNDNVSSPPDQRNNNNKVNENSLLSGNRDIYWLGLGVIFLLISIMFSFTKRRKLLILLYAIFMVASVSCFSYWFIRIKPQIIELRKKWQFYLL